MSELENDPKAFKKTGRTNVIIGITGGIASGKSHLSNIFRELECALFDADKVAKEKLNDNFLKKYLEELGLDINRKMDFRKKFFNDYKLKSKIEEIIHPCVLDDMNNFISSHSEYPSKNIVLDIPLLCEKSLQSHCDIVIFAYCPYNVRRDRALKRGWTLEDFMLREQSQFSTQQKEIMSDVVVPTYDDIVDLKFFSKNILDDISKKL